MRRRGPAAGPQQGRRPGRPPVHDEAWTKVTVVLFNRQIVFLDRLAANIRAQSGAAISRAQLIRALLDAVADADVDLTTATSEADLKATRSSHGSAVIASAGHRISTIANGGDRQARVRHSRRSSRSGENHIRPPALPVARSHQQRHLPRRATSRPGRTPRCAVRWPRGDP